MRSTGGNPLFDSTNILAKMTPKMLSGAVSYGGDEFPDFRYNLPQQQQQAFPVNPFQNFPQLPVPQGSVANYPTPSLGSRFAGQAIPMPGGIPPVPNQLEINPIDFLERVGRGTNPLMELLQMRGAM